MDSDHHHLNYQFSAASLIMVVLLALLVYYLLSILKSSSKNRELLQAPEPAGSWPLIGHLHLLGGRNQLLHKTLGAMADEYGPAFTIRIGFHRALVVSSWEVVKDCFTTNDRVLASRPRSTALKHMCYNYAMSGFGPYGPYWRELRKIVNQELLSNTRIELLKHVWDSEISTSIKELYDEVNCADTKNKEECGQVLVDMKRWFTDLTLNISVKMVAGKRYFSGGSSSKDQGEAERLKKGMRDFFRLVSQFVASDAIPFLEWLDLGGYVREMKSTARELDCLLEGWLEEHKMKRQSKKAGEQDFMDVMLSKLEDAELYGFHPDTVNKATCLTLIMGGSDTTMGTLVWALSLLLNNQHLLKKVQDEMDIHVGRERQVDESDINNLVYLQAIIKETLRLFPAAPIPAPREAMEDCTVAGYHVQAGTRIIVNTWKIQRDSRVWSDPLEFKPDRFLTNNNHMDVDVRGKNFELIPFGSGRRSCPGTSLALQVVHLTLARLIHGFDFKLPSDAPIDMTESAGLTNIKATPLEVMVNPRLPSKLYVFC